jgi:nucleoside-diphosphate-sugar epimerase
VSAAAAARKLRAVFRSCAGTLPSDARCVAELGREAAVVYSAIGVEYTRWVEAWPPIVRSLIEGVGRAGTKLVFADNLYAYGPQSRPLVETTPYTAFGKKPALRAGLARELEASGIPVVIARASDFYGPRVRTSLLGERVFARAIQGKPVQLLGDPDQPHSFTYVTDFAQALVTLGADEAAFGQTWHVPTAAAETPRAIVRRLSALLKRSVRIQPLGPFALTALSLVSPELRELKEMSYEWERPFILDDAKFRTRYYGEPTALDRGLETTLSYYLANEPAGKNAPRSERRRPARRFRSDTPAPA